MNIVYVGDLWHGSTALHRFNAIKENVSNVIPIDSSLNKSLKKINNLLLKLFKYRYDFGVINQLNSKLDHNVDMLWLDKANYLDNKYLYNIKQKYPELFIVFYSPDDYLNKYHLTKQLISSIPFYDLLVTTKSFNVAELYNLGAKNVLYVNNAFEPEVHRPVILSDNELLNYGSDILFIGGFERERADSIVRLAESGVNVTVYGGDWYKLGYKPTNLKVINKWFYQEDYVKIINASKICLNFLRKENRDLQTQRSIEIPACGAFMLSEWSSEHESLFQDKKEAVFFKNDSELISFAKFYLKNENLRSEIAQQGYLRCINSGYSNYHTLSKVLNIVKNGL